MQRIGRVFLSLLLIPSTSYAERNISLRPTVVRGAVQSEELTEAEHLNAQVAKLYGEGKYDEALPLAKRVLEIREKTLGPNGKPVAVALNNLAAIYLAQRVYELAELNYKRSLAIYENLNEASNPNVAKITDSLALLRFQKQDYDHAETLYLRSLAIREASLGPGNVDVIQSLYNLAALYRAISKHEKAASIYERIVALKENVLKAGQSEIGEALEDYACSLRRAHKESETKRAEERISRIFYSPSESKQVANSSLEVLNGKAVNLPVPQYPVLARLNRSFGVIGVRVLIDEAGKVIKACAVDGPASFYDMSERAALGARFTTTLKSGKPVKVIGLITYKFESR